MTLEQAIDEAIEEIKEEVFQNILLRNKGFYNSTHEAYGVMMEEIDELLDELRSNDNRKFAGEAKQVAAIALVMMVQFGKGDIK